MPSAVIVDAVRTPLGRRNGTLKVLGSVNVVETFDGVENISPQRFLERHAD